MEKNITVNRKRAKKLTVSHKKAKITTVNRKSYCPIETLKEVIDHLTYFWLVSISEGVLVGVVNALKTEQKPKIGVVSGAISSRKSEVGNHNVSFLPSLQYDAVKTRSSEYKEKRKK